MRLSKETLCVVFISTRALNTSMDAENSNIARIEGARKESASRNWFGSRIPFGPERLFLDIFNHDNDDELKLN